MIAITTRRAQLLYPSDMDAWFYEADGERRTEYGDADDQPCAQLVEMVDEVHPIIE